MIQVKLSSEDNMKAIINVGGDVLIRLTILELIDLVKAGESVLKEWKGIVEKDNTNIVEESKMFIAKVKAERGL